MTKNRIFSLASLAAALAMPLAVRAQSLGCPICSSTPDPADLLSTTIIAVPTLPSAQPSLQYIPSAPPVAQPPAAASPAPAANSSAP
ncbi:hypothetical protein [Acidocella sp.]|uniref:hypothetical protein n=1 Tax=Acidocella sp. TaxID=50710 RepID=UPI0026057173|nr:hypothetical protein [Acidocella sp.]